MFIVYKSHAPKMGDRLTMARETIVGTLVADGHTRTHTLYPGDRVRVVGMDVQMMGDDYIEVRALRVERADGTNAQVTEAYQTKPTPRW